MSSPDLKTKHNKHTVIFVYKEHVYVLTYIQSPRRNSIDMYIYIYTTKHTISSSIYMYTHQHTIHKHLCIYIYTHRHIPSRSMDIHANIQHTYAYIHTYTTHTTYIQSEESKQNKTTCLEQGISSRAWWCCNSLVTGATKGVGVWSWCVHGRDKKKKRGERLSRAW